MSNSKDTNQQGVEKENKMFSDFSFQPAATSTSSFNLQSSSSMVSSVVRLVLFSVALASYPLALCGPAYF
jgi:hypothetical protein